MYQNVWANRLVFTCISILCVQANLCWNIVWKWHSDLSHLCLGPLGPARKSVLQLLSCFLGIFEAKKNHTFVVGCQYTPEVRCGSEFERQVASSLMYSME